MASPRIHGLLSGLRPFGCAALLLCLVVPANAQPTNGQVVIALALECLSDAPQESSAFHLVPPSSYPMVQQRLLGYWQEEGKTLYLGDSVDVAVPRLSYEVVSSSVRYERVKRTIRRTVDLHATATLVNADNRVLHVVDCPLSRGDALPRKQLEALTSDQFPETVGEPPPAGWGRRILEPAVAISATALGVYLFFTLRSEASSDPEPATILVPLRETSTQAGCIPHVSIRVSSLCRVAPPGGRTHAVRHPHPSNRWATR